MKKIILVISFLFPLFLFAQETRVLNGRYNDGRTFGKPIPDTIRTLMAGTNVAIKSGGSSLVDTISATGGTPSGLTGYIQFNNAGGLGASPNLYWDNTNARLGIGTTSPGYDVDLVRSTNGATRMNIMNSNTGASAQALLQIHNGTHSFQLGILGTGNTGTGLLAANFTYFQTQGGAGTVFRNVDSGSWYFTTYSGSVDNERWRIDYATGNLSNTQATGTAYIDLKAGTTTTAPLLLREGVAPTLPTAGSLWTESINHRLIFRKNATNIELLGTSSVNTVSPTSPDRTLTVVINGTTYYIPAKTTND